MRTRRTRRRHGLPTLYWGGFSQLCLTIIDSCLNIYSCMTPLFRGSRDPTRRRILELLAAATAPLETSRSSSDRIGLGSHHLACSRRPARGRERQGQFIRYRLTRPCFKGRAYFMKSFPGGTMRSRWFGLAVRQALRRFGVGVLPTATPTPGRRQPTGTAGDADGYSSRFWALAVMPVVILGLTGPVQRAAQSRPPTGELRQVPGQYGLIANAISSSTVRRARPVHRERPRYTVQVDPASGGVGLLRLLVTT